MDKVTEIEDVLKFKSKYAWAFHRKRGYHPLIDKALDELDNEADAREKQLKRKIT